MYRFILFLFTSLSTLGFSLNPLSQSIVIGKNSDTVIYQVENKTTSPMAIEISLKKRVMKENGKEDLPQVNSKNFVLFPSQIILKPGQRRGVKVKWVGDKKLKSEKSYRLVAEQLPVDFKKKSKTGVKLLLRYLGALYISKEEFASNVVLKDVKRLQNDLVFTVENKGTKHKLLKKLEVQILKGKKVVGALYGEALKGFSGENVLAHTTRIFKVKYDGKINLDGVKFHLKYE